MIQEFKSMTGKIVVDRIREIRFRKNLVWIWSKFRSQLFAYEPSDKVLLLLKKYKGGEPSRGVVDYSYFLYQTCCDYYGTSRVSAFWEDEVAINGSDPNKLLVKLIHNLKPGYVVVDPCYDDSSKSIMLELLYYVGLKNGTKYLLISTDSVWELNKWRAEKLMPFSFLHICLDSSKFIDFTRFKGRVFGPFHSPYPKTLYDSGKNKERDIDVSFAGTLYGDRLDYINFIREMNLNIFVSGGQSKSKGLERDAYIDILQRSKIVLNFNKQNSGEFEQVKGRVFEATLCGALLFSNDSCETSRFFLPFEEFVPFGGKEDMRFKIGHFLSNSVSFERIRRAGNLKASQCYNGHTFWDFVDKYKNA